MLLIEVAKYLDSEDLGSFDEDGTTGDIFVQKLPVLPHNCITVWPESGREPDVKMGYDKPSLQIIVRNQNAVSGYLKAKQVFDKLHGFAPIELNGLAILSCFCTYSDPAHIGEDKEGRHEYSLNFELEVRNITTFRE